MQTNNAGLVTAVAGVLLSVGFLSLSPQGASDIIASEGTRTEAYYDAVGIPTICNGSTRGVFIGMTSTLDQCEKRLIEDTTYAGVEIKRDVKVKLTQGQYDALVSFVFNVGNTAFRHSTLLVKINAGDCTGAGAQFQRWIYADGKVLPGLKARRAKEAARWLEGCNAWPK